MYKIEYLVIADKETTKSVQALENLLKSDDDIKLQKGRLKVGNFNGPYNISKGKVAASDNKGLYFNLSFTCEREEDIPAFGLALRSVRGRLSILNQKQFVIWDDISRFYSQKAYSKINYIENLMRKLLTKFMLVNLGMNWDKQRMPNDVSTSIHKDNKDFNHFNNVDFIKLSDFLFSKNYPKHKEDVFKKLDAAKDSSDIDLEEIRSLLPRSNWTKYFGSIINCDGDFIKSRWEKLYQLRNSVAHNKTFGLKDLEEVNSIVGEIGQYLEAAVDELDEVIVPADQIDEVVQEVISEGQKEIIEFIDKVDELEKALRKVHEIHLSSDGGSPKDIREVIEAIYLSTATQNAIINRLYVEDTFDIIENIAVKKDLIINRWNADVKDILNQILKQLIKYIPYKEEDHTENIKNKAIIAIYKKLESILLSLNLEVKYNKYYISFRKEDSNVIDIQLQQKSLKVWLNAGKGTLEDVNNITRDVSQVGHLGNGDYEITITDKSQLDNLMKLIQQVLDQYSDQ